MSCMTEVEHMIYKNCRNVAHGRQTNFARITVSPEALADFISKATIAAWFAQVNGELPNPNGGKQWLAWLKQESDIEC